MNTLSPADAFRALSDDKSLSLFNMVAFGLSLNVDDVKTRLGLTERQYYSRMSRLINTGLVMRKKGRALLTSLGKVAYVSHILIGQAIEDYWRLKAIDSITHQGVNAEEHKSIIETLIKSSNIKSVLLNCNIPSGQTDKIRKLYLPLQQKTPF